MAARTQIWCVLLMCVAVVAVDGRTIAQEGGSACKNLNVKTLSFMSPPVRAKPGEVNNKYSVGEFPKGHIGIKSLNAELVDANGAPVPLSEVYLHHWVMIEMAMPKDAWVISAKRLLGYLLRHMRRHHKHRMHHDPTAFVALKAPRMPIVRSFLGKGGETRHTESRFPGPYVLESGKPSEGYETVWILNVHGLDTRGAVNRMGCTECSCDLYNATTDVDGSPLPEGYMGGLRCCGTGSVCALEEGYSGEERTFYLKILKQLLVYTWEYVDWNECLIPTQSTRMDITNRDGFGEDLIEFTVEGCGDADPNSEACVDTREATRVFPVGGELVYAVSHLHATALDAALYGEDGRLICRSTPIYGQGAEAGNEKNFVVGIEPGYNHPGSPNAMRIHQGEKVKFVVKTSKVGGPHTGLMAVGKVEVVLDGVLSAI